VALGLLPVCWVDPSTFVALGLLPRCWQTKHTRDAWSPASVLDTPLRTHGVWAACLGAGHAQRTRGTWAVPTPNYPRILHAAEPKIALGHWLCRTQNTLQIALCPASVKT